MSGQWSHDLIEDPELSHHADKRYGENDIFDNILIQGDNLLALKALGTGICRESEVSISIRLTIRAVHLSIMTMV